ncbi:MAG TPA: four helix bundle protein [Candidatus Kapabacteria bacterium]|nr:four helix bundle protein [Candidatus Kapabacteria bacterium]
MAKITKFEDLIAWQRSREVCNRIYDATRKGPFAKDFGLSNQIQRASVSTMSNIAEGFERGRKAEFHQFLSIAKGSCGEVRSQLYVAYDNKYLSEQVFTELKALVEETGRIINGLRMSIEKNPDAGFKLSTQH